jgi:trehalose 6-phosphate synthase
MAAAGHVNAAYGTEEWEPIRVLVGESYSRAIEALKYYDVLLVNSIADGMNLVAKEGPIVNQRNGVLVLSERTGAQEQLGESAITISPCDVYATAEALYQGLNMSEDERKERSERLRWNIEKEDIHDWFCKQLDSVENLIG